MRFRNPTHGSRLAGLFMLAVLPVSYEPGEEHVPKTLVRVMGGGGQYGIIQRGCEGQVRRSATQAFTEYSIAAEHSRPLGEGRTVALFGATVSRLRLDEREDLQWDRRLEARSSWVVHPTVGIEGRNAGVRLGFVATDDFIPGQGGRYHPSVYFRLGRATPGYISASWLDSTPLLTPGYVTLGVGLRFAKWHVWSGVSRGEPYDGAGLVVRGGVEVRRNLHVDAMVRRGTSGGIDENAAGLGITYVFRHGAR